MCCKRVPAIKRYGAVLGFALGCGSAETKPSAPVEPATSSDAMGGSGAASNSGGAGTSSGGAGPSSGGAESNSSGAGASSGGAGASSGGAGPNSGGAEPSSGGAASSSGGAASSSGGAASSSGGAAATQGTLDGTCSFEQEGYSTVSAKGQDGTFGGRDGMTVTVSNQADLTRYAAASEPYTIRVDGAIKISPKGREIEVQSDKTIIGVGKGGEIVEGGFKLNPGVHNVIFRNLTVRDTFVEGDWDGKTQDFDGIQMDTAHHVWIDHCEFHHIGDGIIDSRKDTTNLTVSWTIMRDHNKAFGIGWTDNLTAEMTIHHNIFRDTKQRNPSTDNVLRAHLYNNLLQNVSLYGNWARGRTNMVLENSVFDNVVDPYFLNSTSITTAGGGTLIAINNLVRDTSTGLVEASGSVYDFFNPRDHYPYVLDPVDQVEETVTKCAGPQAELGL